METPIAKHWFTVVCLMLGAAFIFSLELRILLMFEVIKSQLPLLIKVIEDYYLLHKLTIQR
jgi:hypothetical protein